MFDRYVVQETKIITPPDRLLTEMYKDERQRQQRRFEVIRDYTKDVDLEKLKEILYKHPNGPYIFGGRIFKKDDLEAYIDYRTKEWV